MTTQEATKTVLAIGAHPGAVEQACSGTLSLMREEGWNVVIATMTPGDKGSHTLDSEAIAKVRKQEAKESAALLDARVHCLEWRELAVFFGDMACKRTTALLRSVRPQIVMTHPPRDCFTDHEQTSLIVRHACLAAVAPNYTIPGYPGETIPLPLDAVPHLYYFDAVDGIDVIGDPVTASVIVDVSAVFELKKRAVEKHDSQRELARSFHGIDDYAAQMTAFSKVRGREAKVDHGEGFRQHVGRAFPRDEMLSGILGERVTLIESS